MQRTEAETKTLFDEVLHIKEGIMSPLKRVKIKIYWLHATNLNEVEIMTSVRKSKRLAAPLPLPPFTDGKIYAGERSN